MSLIHSGSAAFSELISSSTVIASGPAQGRRLASCRTDAEAETLAKASCLSESRLLRAVLSEELVGQPEMDTEAVLYVADELAVVSVD